MISDAEKERMRIIEEAVHDLTATMGAELGADPDDVGLQAKAVGAQLATMDALFAIREGTEWRGLSDPREITAQLLRDAGVGDLPDE